MFFSENISDEKAAPLFESLHQECNDIFTVDPYYVEGIVKYCQFLVKINNYSLAKSIYEESIDRFQMESDVDSVENAAILFVSLARLTYLIMREESECLDIYKRALISCNSSRYVFGNYILHLSMTVGAIEGMLDEVVEWIRSSNLTEQEKKDFCLKVKTLYEERGKSTRKVNEFLDSMKNSKHSLDQSSP